MEFAESCADGAAAFDTGYDYICKKYAIGQGDSLDKDFYEYVCDSILVEGEITESSALEVVQSFYPDYPIDNADVSVFIRAAKGLQKCRNPAPKLVEAVRIDAADMPDVPPPPEQEKDIWTEQNVEDISYICSIFPNIDISIIEYAYMSKCARNKEPTVDFLLENCPDDEGIQKMVAKMIEIRDKKRRDAEKAAEEQRKMQAVVFQKYGDRVVLPVSGGKNGNKKEEKVNLVLNNPISGTNKPSKVSDINEAMKPAMYY